MDWASVAKILSEQGERPLALLDASGKVRMINRALEKAFGFSRFQVECKDWSSVFFAKERAAEARSLLAAAMSGTLPRHDITLRTLSGSHVRASLEFTLVGEGPSQGLLMSATRILPVWRPERSAHSDREYEISVVGPQFGSLIWLCASGSLVQTLEHETRCYSLFHGLTRPCADCPVLKGDADTWPRTRIKHRQVQSEPGSMSVFEVVVAEEVDNTAVRVRVRHIDDGLLSAIQDAKVQWLADKAGLSRREREVFGHLLLGRTIEDISQLVGISSRTVKHHQASVLRKLGADSRADLVRVVF